MDTPAGALTLRVPESRGYEEPFFPRSGDARAALVARGDARHRPDVHPRRLRARRGEGDGRAQPRRLPSTQVSRAAGLLDEELEAWRNRWLGPVRHLVLDARYEKIRGVVRDAAILSAVGMEPEGRRRLLGVSTAFLEAEVRWRTFLDSLIERGLRGEPSCRGRDGSAASWGR